MRRITFLLAVALCLVVQNQAQAQRRLPSQKGIQFTGGTVNGLNFDSKSDGFSFHFGAAVSTYAKSGNHLLFGGEYLQKQYLYSDMRLPLAQFTGEGGYFLNFLSDGSKTVFLSLGVSVMAGYETINWNDKLLPDGQPSKTAMPSCMAVHLRWKWKPFWRIGRCCWSTSANGCCSARP